jgi:hypothetical protein
MTTHHLHGEHFIRDDNGVPYGVRDFDPKFAQGVAPVFHVPDLEAAVAGLAAGGVALGGAVERGPYGATARFNAPSGHLFFIYEPSSRALATAAGRRLRALLGATV